MHDDDVPLDIDALAATDRLERRVVRVCDAVGQFIEYWGFKAIHGRIWTLLALSRAPVTQVEVARTLGVSRSLLSGAMAELAGYGLVRAVDDHRNAPFVAVLDVWPTISDVLRSREWILLETARLALEAALEEQKAQPGSPWDQERLELLLGMTELAQTLLRLLISVRTPRGLAPLAGWLKRAVFLARRFGR